MKKLSFYIGILLIFTLSIVVGCSENLDVPSRPLSIEATAPGLCGEVDYLSRLSPVLAVWEDSIEAWQASGDFLNTTPVWTDTSTVGDYLVALVPVLQQWETSLNDSLGSAVIDTVPDFNPTTSSHQVYLGQLSSLMLSWRADLNTARGSAFLSEPPVFQPDVTAPAITCPGDTVIECVTEDSLAVNYVVTAFDDCSPSAALTCVPPSGSKFPIGTTTVTCTAVDTVGNTSTCSFNVTLQAPTPPVITSLTTSISQIWPPNHKWVSVEVTPVVETSCDMAVTTRIVEVVCDQGGNGSGHTDTESEITGNTTCNLRAERSGNSKAGRTYTIRVRAEITPDLFDEATVTVVVPHDQGGGH
jgi:HYR domain-containing protein